MKHYCLCKVCGRLTVARAVGADWSNAIYPVRHNHKGIRCEGIYHEVSKIYTREEAQRQQEAS